MNGWNLGIDVTASYDEKTDCDVFRVYINGGSRRGNPTYNVKEMRNEAGQLTGFEVSERPAEVPDGA